jgi:hypothetical protein
MAAAAWIVPAVWRLLLAIRLVTPGHDIWPVQQWSASSLAYKQHDWLHKGLALLSALSHNKSLPAV